MYSQRTIEIFKSCILYNMSEKLRVQFSTFIEGRGGILKLHRGSNYELKERMWNQEKQIKVFVD